MLLTGHKRTTKSGHKSNNHPLGIPGHQTAPARSRSRSLHDERTAARIQTARTVGRHERPDPGEKVQLFAHVAVRGRAGRVRRRNGKLAAEVE